MALGPLITIIRMTFFPSEYQQETEMHGFKKQYKTLKDQREDNSQSKIEESDLQI